MTPLVVPDNGSTGPGVVLGVERVRGASAVFKLLHLVQLQGDINTGYRIFIPSFFVPSFPFFQEFTSLN